MREHATSIFAEMSDLARQTESINLGQGFPDTDGPAEVAEVAEAAEPAPKKRARPKRDPADLEPKKVSFASAKGERSFQAMAPKLSLIHI